jgi:hypothetical protein
MITGVYTMGFSRSTRIVGRPLPPVVGAFVPAILKTPCERHESRLAQIPGGV